MTNTDDFLIDDFMFECSPDSNATPESIVHTPPEQQMFQQDWSGYAPYVATTNTTYQVASSPEYASSNNSPIQVDSPSKPSKRSRTSSDEDQPPCKKRKRAAEQVEDDNAKLQELCKKKNAILSEEEKKMKRVLRNRQSAAKSREKKRAEIEMLQEKNELLQKRVDELEAKLYVVLLHFLQLFRRAMEQQNAYLQQAIQQPTNFSILTNESEDTSGPILELSQRGYGSPIAPALFVIVFCVGLFFLSSTLMFGSTRQHGHVSHVPKSYTSTPVTSTTSSNNNPTSPTSRQILSTSETRDTAATRSSSGNTSYEKCNWKQDHDSTTPIVEDDVKLTTRVDSPLIINLSDMEKSTIFYPKTMERHFGFKKSETPLHTPKNNSAETTTLDAEKNESISTSTTLNGNVSSELVISNSDAKKNNYEIAYLLQQHDEKTGKKSLVILCPFSYPLLPNADGSSQQQQQETLDLTVLIPDSRTVSLDTSNEFVEVRRVAKITAENMAFHEAFIAFPKPSIVK